MSVLKKSGNVFTELLKSGVLHTFYNYVLCDISYLIDRDAYLLLQVLISPQISRCIGREEILFVHRYVFTKPKTVSNHMELLCG